MKKNPAYQEMAAQIAKLQKVQEYVDLARTFRDMERGETLTLSTTRGAHGFGAHTITIDEKSVGTIALKFLAQCCEDTAVRLNAGKTKKINVRAACKV